MTLKGFSDNPLRDKDTHSHKVKQEGDFKHEIQFDGIVFQNISQTSLGTEVGDDADIWRIRAKSNKRIHVFMG